MNNMPLSLFIALTLALTTQAAPQLYKMSGGQRVPFSAQEQAAWEAQNEGAEALTRAKAAKYAAIDAKTDALIAAGTFEYNGKTFGMSDRERRKWHGVGSVSNAGGGGGQKVTAKDRTRLTLSNAADAKGFFIAGATAESAIHASAEALDDAVTAATTRAQVTAVIDGR